jgi:signal transduction histidine kinase
MGLLRRVRPAPRPRRYHLRRQLTVSVVQTTFLTAVVLELLFLSLVWLHARSPNVIPEIISSLNGETRRLAPLLEPEIRDKAVRQWLTDRRYSIGGGGLRLGETWKKEPVHVALVLPGGEVWGAAPEDATLEPELRALAGHALAGERDPGKLGEKLPTTAVLGAAPVTDDKGRVLAAVAFRTPPLFWINPGATLFTVALVALVPALFSAVIGGIAGWLSARRLTRRFDAIARAADGWARGELHERAPESESDELGRLAGRLNRMAEELAEALATRRALAAAEERNRLARDLHDTVKQQAFAAAMQAAAAKARLAASDSTGAGSHLAETETLIKTMQADLTAIIAELRPAESDAPLAERLQKLATDWSRTSAIAATVSGSAPPLPEPTLREILLLTQEALANVARHSGAKSVRLTLARAGESLTLTIADDGAGFDVSQAPRGLGLTSMRERAESLPAGAFALSSIPGQGTTITVSLKP